MKIAITGNIGSGKSYVCDLFKSQGVPVFDSDREAKLLYDLPEVRQKMVERFGAQIYQDNGVLDRRLRRCLAMPVPWVMWSRCCIPS